MNFDLLIVGAGLSGASLAAALRGSRLSIALLERQAPKTPQGLDSRIYAISPANVDFLQQCGVWAHLDPAQRCAVQEMRIFGDHGGSLEFSAYDCGLGELAWILEAGRMQHELWETVKRQHNLQLICPAEASSLQFEAETAHLSLADGRSLRARLVVAADGVQSWVRQQAGIEARFTPYHEQGVVANFRCERPHRGIAWQWFRADGILAWLPLPGNQISMVWSTHDAHAAELLALPPEALCARVAAAGENRLGPLELLTPAAAFPLRLMRIDPPIAHRLVLIGDAAHAIHPLSGHGINLGFQDARSLAEKLADLPSWRDPGEAAILRAHARARAEETLLLQGTTHALNRLFHPNHPLISGLRNFGMNLTDRLPVLRNMLVRYAVRGRF